MLYIVFCRDNPEVSARIREECRDAHLAYLAEHASKIVLGGALLMDDGVTRAGSALVLNVRTREDAENFSINEPFRRAGLYSNVTISRMRRAQWRPELAPISVDGE